MMKYSITTLLLIANLFLFTGCDERSKENKTKTRVKLILRSNPKGAAVYLDGKSLGEKTPLETILDDNNEHMVELRANNCEPKWIRIPDSYGETGVEHDFGEIKLRKIRVPMIVESEPMGAFVSIDGEDLGKTPIYLKAISPGMHNATFRFTGHAQTTRRIDVEADELKRVKVSLESITGIITVITNPVGADVYLDGNLKGVSNETGRLVIKDIDEGRHSVKIVKAGFHEIKQQVIVKANENKTVSPPELRQLPGSLKIISEPAGAKVYRNTLLVGETPMVMKSLEAKQYTIKVEMPGHSVGRKIVKVIPGLTKQVDFTLDSIYGSIILISEPSECNIIVGGVLKGKTEAGDAPGISKPMTVANIKPGVHTIVFEKAGYESMTQQVLVSKGKQTRVPTTKLKTLWLPTHSLKTRGEMRAKNVKILSDDGRNIEIEYKVGNGMMRYQIKKSDVVYMKQIK